MGNDLSLKISIQAQDAASKAVKAIGSSLSSLGNVAKVNLGNVGKAASSAGTDISKLSKSQIDASVAGKRLEVAQAGAAMALKKAEDIAAGGKASTEQLTHAQARAALSAEKVKSAEHALAGAVQKASSEMQGGSAKTMTLKEHLASLENTVRNTGGGFLNFASKVSMVGMGVAGMVRGAIDLGTSLFEPLMSAEQLGIAFTTLTGSTEAATKQIKELNTFADITPFEPGPVQEYAAQLIGMGIAADQTIPIMTAVGDALFGIGHGTEAEMKSVVDQIGKIRVAGKMTWGDISQLQMHGIDVLGAMSLATGKTKDALKDMSSNGGIPAGEAIDALTKGIELNPLYQGGMAKQASSLSGIMSTLTGYVKKAANSFLGLNEGGQVIAGSLLDKLKGGITAIGTAVQNPAFQKFAVDMGDKIGKALDNVGKFVQTNVVPAFNKFMDVLKSPQFADFAKKLGELGSQLRDVIAPAFTDTKPKVDALFTFIKNTAIPALTDLTSKLTDTIKFLKDHGNAVSFVATLITALYVPALIKAGVEAVIAGMKTGSSFVASIIKVGIEGFVAAGKLLAFIIQIIATGVQATIAGGKIALSFVGNLIAAGAKAVWAGTVIAAQFVSSMARAGFEAVASGLKIAVQFVASMVKAGVEAAIAGAKIAISFVAGLIASGAQAVIAGALILGSFVASLVVAAANAVIAGIAIMIGLVPALWATAVAVIAATWPFLLIAAIVVAVVAIIILAVMNWGTISKWLQGAWAAFSSWFMGIMGAIGAWVGSVVGNIVGFFQSLPGRVMGFLQSLPGKVMGIWNTLKTDALNAGANIVKAIGDGISGAIHWVTDAVGKVTGWIRDHLPHSPAKVGPLRDLPKQGQMITEQISEGMLKGVPALDATINNEVLHSLKAPGLNTNVGSSFVGKSAVPAGGGGSAVVVNNNFNVTINAPAMTKTDAKKLVDELEDELSRRFNKSGNMVTWTSGGRT